LTVTFRVDVLFEATGSVVADATDALDVMVCLLPVMKKLTWKLIDPPAGMVTSAGTDVYEHVNVVPAGGGHQKLFETYLPCLTVGSAWVITTFWASDGP
jgi:hypothetical protein